MTDKKISIPNDKTFVFKIGADEIINEKLLLIWTKEIDSSLASSASLKIEKLILDLSQKATLKNNELSHIARILGMLAKKKYWKLIMLCNNQIDELVESQGLNNLIACYQVNNSSPQADSPSQDAKVSTLNEDSVKNGRKELSLFIKYFPEALEQIINNYSKVSLIIENSTAVSGKVDIDLTDNEAACFEIESVLMNFRVLIIIDEVSKKILMTKILKQNLQKNPFAGKDFLVEICNNVLDVLKNKIAKNILASPLNNITSIANSSEFDESYVGPKIILNFSEKDTLLKLKAIIGHRNK